MQTPYGGYPVLYQWLAGVLPLAIVLACPVLTLVFPHGVSCLGCWPGGSRSSRPRPRRLLRSPTFTGLHTNPFLDGRESAEEARSKAQTCRRSASFQDEHNRYPYLDELKRVVRTRSDFQPRRYHAGGDLSDAPKSP